MPGFIDRDEVRRLVNEQGAQVAEVLPQPEYDWAHLAGATHLPLKRLSRDLAKQRLAGDRPVIVYCHDTECDMSPRAAWRLETYGYGPVYDYVAGKADWLAFNLRRDGWARLAGDVLTTAVPTCSWRDRLGDIRSLLQDSPRGLVVALNEHGVVLGALRPDALEHHDDAYVEEAMHEGPTTVRPSEELDGLVTRMRNANVDAVLVTSSDGRLLGLLERARAEHWLHTNQEDHHHEHADR